MSYPKDNWLWEELRETLFLILARQNDLQISEHTDRCERTITTHKAELMRLFKIAGKTDLAQIYHKAKRMPDLCLQLAKEFGQKYPQFVATVVHHDNSKMETTMVDGKEEVYIWVW